VCLSGLAGVTGGKRVQPSWAAAALARKMSSSLVWLDVALSKQRLLGGVINFMWGEVESMRLFLFVHSNLYIAIYVYRE
jgi:hypothetical protein